MLRGEHYTITTDIWSAGVVLYAMTHGHLPFKEHNKETLIQSILNNEPVYDENLSPDLLSLLNHLLTKNCVQRATHNVIIKNKWVQQYPNAQYIANELVGAHDYLIRKRVNNSIVKSLQQRGLNTHSVMAALNSKDFSGISAPYLIIAQKNMISKLYLTVFNKNFSMSTISEKRPEKLHSKRSPSYQRVCSSLQLAHISPTKMTSKAPVEKRIPLYPQIHRLTTSTQLSKTYL